MDKSCKNVSVSLNWPCSRTCVVYCSNSSETISVFTLGTLKRQSHNRDDRDTQQADRREDVHTLSLEVVGVPRHEGVWDNGDIAPRPRAAFSGRTMLIVYTRKCMRAYPKVSGLLPWSENCKW
jgi:hypothetical protein